MTTIFLISKAKTPKNITCRPSKQNISGARRKAENRRKELIAAYGGDGRRIHIMDEFGFGLKIGEWLKKGGIVKRRKGTKFR
jgi:hypothetical protein